MANAQSLFGFGQDLSNQDVNTSLQGLQGQLAIGQDLRNLIALGGNLGGTAANAGANVGQFNMQGASSNPMAALLSGLGTGLFQSANQGYRPVSNPGLFTQPWSQASASGSAALFGL
jgi:hypothetical protein